MPESQSAVPEMISRERLAELLNEDLSREYQAIIAYVVYSQVLSGAQYMDIAAQLEIHAKQELDHARRSCPGRERGSVRSHQSTPSKRYRLIVHILLDSSPRRFPCAL
jgi:Ferritin-like domain